MEAVRIADPKCCVVTDFPLPAPWLMCLFVIMVMYPFFGPSGLDLGPSTLGKSFKFFSVGGRKWCFWNRLSGLKTFKFGFWGGHGGGKVIRERRFGSARIPMFSRAMTKTGCRGKAVLWPENHSTQYVTILGLPLSRNCW